MESILQKLGVFRGQMEKDSIVVFTSDIDWASEYSISNILEYFHSKNIQLTTFLTHRSAVLEKELKENKIQGGIHPNFLPDSSQGNNFDEVIDFCFSLLPDARAFRAHRYFDVNDTIDKLFLKGIKYESNICTFLDPLPPFLHRSGMVGFPIFLEDGGYLYQKGSLQYEDIRERIHSPGLKVINIHPFHFALNTPYYAYTREIKDRLSREEYNRLGEDEINRIRWKGQGITNFIMDMVEDIKATGVKTAFMDDIYSYILTL